MWFSFLGSMSHRNNSWTDGYRAPVVKSQQKCFEMTRTTFQQQKYRFRWKWQKILGSDCIICNEFMSSRKPWRARTGFVGCWGRFYPSRNYLQFQGLWAASKQPADKERKAKAACWEAKRGRPIYWGPTERESQARPVVGTDGRIVRLLRLAGILRIK